MTSDPAAVESMRQRVRDLMPRARADLARLVRHRSVADPSIEPREECAAAAATVAELYTEAGLSDVRRVDTPDGSEAVFAERPGRIGAPTVLLYSHYDVQPAGPRDAWSSPPFELTERGGRWYGRGAADCKGNLVMHLTALRAVEGDGPTVRLVCDGSEEQPSDGLRQLLVADPEAFRADVIVVADTGNVSVGVPTVTTSLRGTGSVVVTVSTLESAVHSGMFGGAAPDALSALIAMLATLHDSAGDTTIRGLASSSNWEGAAYDEQRFRGDATVLAGVSLVGSGRVADALWARPSATVLAIDCPSVEGATAALQPSARALISLRVPPGTDASTAQDLLVRHLEDAAPWGARVEVRRLGRSEPFFNAGEGTAYGVFREAMEAAFGAVLTTAGQGGSIPLCSSLVEAFPRAEILLCGVEEAACRIHAPDESVHPGEIERMAVAEALFLSWLSDI